MDRYRDWLDDWVDGALEAGKRAELEAHLQGCAECRALVEELQTLKRAASGLARRDPPTTLWPRIAAAIRPGAAQDGTARPVYTEWRRVLLPLAAVFLLAAAAGLLRVTLQNLGEPATRVANEPARDASAEVSELNGKEYEGAISDLQQLVQRDNSLFDPVVAQALQAGLSTCDQAIGESRAAVTAQPDDEMAKESLLDAFRRKLLLLENTIVLLNDIRKGDVDPGTLRQIQDIQGRKGATKS